jgi:vacuolar-type H+-ATPase subunit C/Vma6
MDVLLIKQLLIETGKASLVAVPFSVAVIYYYLFLKEREENKLLRSDIRECLKKKAKHKYQTKYLHKSKHISPQDISSNQE